jgi:hypothetical protein
MPWYLNLSLSVGLLNSLTPWYLNLQSFYQQTHIIPQYIMPITSYTQFQPKHVKRHIKCQTSCIQLNKTTITTLLKTKPHVSSSMSKKYSQFFHASKSIHRNDNCNIIKYKWLWISNIVSISDFLNLNLISYFYLTIIKAYKISSVTFYY